MESVVVLGFEQTLIIAVKNISIPLSEEIILCSK